MASSAISTVGLGAKVKMPMWRFRKEIVTYASLIPYIAFSLFPLYIMFITSLKSKQEINNLGASPFWATGITLENYVYLAENTHFFDYWAAEHLHRHRGLNGHLRGNRHSGGLRPCAAALPGRRGLRGARCSSPTWCRRRCCSCRSST